MAQALREFGFGAAAIEPNSCTAEEFKVAMSRQHKYAYFESGNSVRGPDLFSVNDPYGVQSEAIRSLRSDLMLRGFGDGNKLIAVVGGRTGDGASVVSANLAISFAQLGKRTFLIDADMRKPRQHVLFGIDDGPGLSSVLSGRHAMNDLPAKTQPFENLTVLRAGPVPPNPQELLSRVGFSYLIETTPTSFDLVIIDTPPILEFADAQIIANRAGSCLCVARRDKTSLLDIGQVRVQLERAGVKAVGAVVCL